MAMTFTPSEGVNQDGSTFADSNAGTFDVRSGGKSVDAVKVTDELTGQETWDAEVANYREDNGGFNVDDYADSLAETTPHLSQALQWAGNGGLTPQQQAEHDEAMESDDPDVLNRALEKLMDAFFQENSVSESDWIDEEVEVEPVSQEEVNDVVDELTSNEPEGTETAFQFLQQAQASEDPMERELLIMSSQFHRGESSASFLIQKAIDRYGQDAIAPFIRKWMK